MVTRLTITLGMTARMVGRWGSGRSTAMLVFEVIVRRQMRLLQLRVQLLERRLRALFAGRQTEFALIAVRIVIVAFTFDRVQRRFGQIQRFPLGLMVWRTSCVHGGRRTCVVVVH